jgi:hypothetical protein
MKPGLISQNFINARSCFLDKNRFKTRLLQQMIFKKNQLDFTKICSPIDVSCRISTPISLLAANSSSDPMDGFIFGVVSDDVTIPV